MVTGEFPSRKVSVDTVFRGGYGSRWRGAEQMDPSKSRTGMLSYIRYRIENGNMFWTLWPFLMIFMSIASVYSSYNKLIYYFVDLIVVLAILEVVFVKCPDCGNRPKRLLRQFPELCPHCGKEFLKKES
jgi:hypothetical protein